MKFDQQDPGNILYIGDRSKNILFPDPEVGKIYHGFIDGKINEFRLLDWKITKRIDLDHDKISKNLIKNLQHEINEFYWCYEPEQTIIYRGYPIDSSGKRCGGYAYFLKTKHDTWFSALSNFLEWSELDTDNRWYNLVINKKSK